MLRPFKNIYAFWRALDWHQLRVFWDKASRSNPENQGINFKYLFCLFSVGIVWGFVVMPITIIFLGIPLFFALLWLSRVMTKHALKVLFNSAYAEQSPPPQQPKSQAERTQTKPAN